MGEVFLLYSGGGRGGRGGGGGEGGGEGDSYYILGEGGEAVEMEAHLRGKKIL